MFSIINVEYVVILFLYAAWRSAKTTAIWQFDADKNEESTQQIKIWLTISARKHFLQVSWVNAPIQIGDTVILTLEEPQKFQLKKVQIDDSSVTFENVEGSGYKSSSTNTTETDVFHADNLEAILPSQNSSQTWQRAWITDNIITALKPTMKIQWITTGVLFDFAISRNITYNTDCYGYWASYVNNKGEVLGKTCLRAFPRWMNNLHSIVGDLRLRDIFIPGTHDSGAYRPNFDPYWKETLVTKYSLTQDDDIYGQLMHGVRYLDIRVGYYQNTQEKFFINHGITRQRPLYEIISQVKNFVLETNEIVILGFKEFPVGFGRDLKIHRLLVGFLKDHLAGLIVHPSVTWSVTLKEIWSRQNNLILAYDQSTVVFEFPQFLFSAIEQRWANAQSWNILENYLRTVNTFDVSRLSSRPVADMAELTPDTWSVILDKYGGLRKMADSINWQISHLYRDELGEYANIVAADFIRGTTLVETAIEWNKKKVIF